MKTTMKILTIGILLGMSFAASSCKSHEDTDSFDTSMTDSVATVMNGAVLDTSMNTTGSHMNSASGTREMKDQENAEVKTSNGTTDKTVPGTGRGGNGSGTGGKGPGNQTDGNGRGDVKQQ